MEELEIKIIKKRVKNITLKVKPNCEVILTAPYFTEDEYLESFIKKKEDWIKRQLEFFRSKTVVQREYVSGEDFYYLGRRFRLKVIENDTPSIKLDRNYCYLYIKDKNDFFKKQNLVQKWYAENAREVFFEIIEKYQKIVKRRINKITVRKMKTRWGSCNPAKGYINLNLELIKKPKECIEYVIFHELAHLIYPNHSKDFYNYLSTYMLDWKRRKEKLEK